MRRHLFTAVLALAGISGLTHAGEQYATPPALRIAAIPPGQPASTPTPVNAEPAPRTGVGVGTKPAPELDEPCANADWTCGPPSRFWVRGEYLLWWIKEGQLPALITTGVPGASAFPGVLGQSDTRVLFGGTEAENQSRAGGRVSGGLWLNDCQTVGLDASYFFLGSRSTRFDSGSSGALGSAMIGRPFFDVLNNIQNAQLVAFPGIASGDIHITSFSRLQGADINVLCIPCCKACCDPCADQACPTAAAPKHGNTCCGGSYWLSVLGGIRYLQLDDGLDITESSRVNPALPAGSPLFGGSTITMTDQFDTHNYFYGAQVGAQAEFCWGRLFVDVLGKVAVGVTRQVVDVRGSTVIISPTGATAVTPAGFLATASNSGHFSRDQFAVVPELGINVGCYITRHLRAFVGYTFLYWSSVVRPGDQVDVGLNGTQIPTDSRFNTNARAARPAVLLQDTDFWAQGINFGLEFRY